MQKRYTLALCLSLLLHLAVMAVVWMDIRFEQNPPDSPIDVTIFESAAPRSGPLEKSRAGFRKNYIKALRRFLPQYDVSFMDPSKFPRATIDNRTPGTGTLAELMSPEIAVLSRIHAKIDEGLYYPGILASYKMEDTVRAQLFFNELGALDESRLVVNGANRYFVNFIRKFLSVNFRDPLPFLKNRKVPVPIECTFEFRISEDDGWERSKRQFVLGRHLAFYRHQHASRMQWRLGPLSGMAPLPVLSLDVMWFAEQYERLNGKYRDPLQEFVN